MRTRDLRRQLAFALPLSSFSFAFLCIRIFTALYTPDRSLSDILRWVQQLALITRLILVIGIML